ncbi:SHOCT domain-containing protein [Natrarchaeobius sp. A-rgal3]|uniref:SHOCT domain-containing protein n=1 Tax=Natrarchaeobius versutus TaxID=1679078 RepID=UPI00350FD23C
MTGEWSGAERSMPAAIVIVGLLLAFVALAAIDTGVALIVAIFAFVFGGEIFGRLAAAVVGATDESATDADEESDDEDPNDALERLRARYADGELSDAEFERRLEILLETETVADVERYLANGDQESEAERANADTVDCEDERELERSSG